MTEFAASRKHIMGMNISAMLGDWGVAGCKPMGSTSIASLDTAFHKVLEGGVDMRTSVSIVAPPL